MELEHSNKSDDEVEQMNIIMYTNLEKRSNQVK